MDDKYEAPTLTLVGSVESLTAAGKLVGSLDASYPVGTPSGSQLFS